MKKAKKKPVVVFIDELETLKNSEADFHLVFELLSFQVPGFIKIGVSNTMDLFTHALGRTKFLQYQFLTFVPYTEEQLAAILSERISGVGEAA